jgi:hypothetical protein
MQFGKNLLLLWSVEFTILQFHFTRKLFSTMRVLVFLLIFALSACQKKDKNSFKVFSKHSLDLQAADSFNLQNNESPIGMVSTFFSLENVIAVPDLTSKTVHIFNKKGNIIANINRMSVKDEIIPQSSPTAIIESDETLHFLYSKEKVVFKFTLDGVFVEKLYLNFNSFEMELDTFSPFFAIDKQSKNYYIGINENTDYSPSKYKDASFIGIFNSKGELTNAFGNYPSYYSKGYFIPTLGYSACFSDDKIYVVFQYDNKITEYNLTGDKQRDYYLTETDMSKDIAFKPNPILSISEIKINGGGFYSLQKIWGKNQFYIADNIDFKNVRCRIFDFDKHFVSEHIVKTNRLFFNINKGLFEAHNRFGEEMSVIIYKEKP